MRLRNKPNAIPEMKENFRMVFDAEKYKGKWSEVFSNDNPIYLEIGSGRGDFITEIAENNPDINFIALEMNTNAFVVASRKFVEKKLDNVRGIIGKAERLEDYFDKDEIERIYINFSTPWSKKRHHKRRLSHKNFLNLYKNILKKSSILEMKTDNRDFFEDSLVYFDENDLEILDKSFDLSLEDSKYISEYEKKFRDKNIPICYAKVRF